MSDRLLGTRMRDLHSRHSRFYTSQYDEEKTLNPKPIHYDKYKYSYRSYRLQVWDFSVQLGPPGLGFRDYSITTGYTGTQKCKCTSHSTIAPKSKP